MTLLFGSKYNHGKEIYRYSIQIGRQNTFETTLPKGSSSSSKQFYVTRWIVWSDNDNATTFNYILKRDIISPSHEPWHGDGGSLEISHPVQTDILVGTIRTVSQRERQTETCESFSDQSTTKVVMSQIPRYLCMHGLKEDLESKRKKEYGLSGRLSSVHVQSDRATYTVRLVEFHAARFNIQHL